MRWIERTIWLVALAAIVGLYALVATLHHGKVGHPLGDTWAHVAAIRRTLERGPFPGDLFYGGGFTQPYYSLEHVAMAAASWLTGLSPHVLFIGAAPWIAISNLLAAALFLNRITGDLRVAVFGSLIELLPRMPAALWSILPLPGTAALTPRYLCWYAYLRARDEDSRAWLFGSGLALGACIATHLAAGATCTLGLVLLELAQARRPRAVAPPAIAFATGIVVASPWVGNFIRAWFARVDVTDPVFSAGRAASFVHWWGYSLQVYSDPLVRILPGAMFFLAILGFIRALTHVVRGDSTVADRFAVWSVGAGSVLLYTPVFGLVAPMLGTWAPRLVLIFPFSLLFGLAGAAAMDRISAGLWVPLRQRAGQLAALLLLYWIASSMVSSTSLPTALSGFWSTPISSPLGAWDIEERLASSGPVPHLVLSDPETSYSLPYLTGAYVVTVTPGHSSPYVNHRTRLRDVRDFYVADRGTLRRHHTLDQYGADGVAVNLDREWPRRGDAARLLERLRADPSFVETGCCDRVVFFRYDPDGALRHTQTGSPPALVDREGHP